MTIERVRGRSPFEEAVGSARAVAAGERVTATALPFLDGVVEGEGDPHTQARVAFTLALDALAELGADVDAVVRTRLYLAHTRDVDAVSRAHQEVFGAVRPVTTLVVVSGFADSRVLVEVEVEAHREVSGERS
ncbi:Rid family hydrolase [Streptomyces chumphonensis]|uniref:Rid family hydrolase n=1 Tax=Streptomyces chumphonensis TaxID=1214925 RepID=UPI003D71AC77